MSAAHPKWAQTMSAGYKHSILLRDDGLALAWGDDSYGKTAVWGREGEEA